MHLIAVHHVTRWRHVTSRDFMTSTGIVTSSDVMVCRDVLISHDTITSWDVTFIHRWSSLCNLFPQPLLEAVCNVTGVTSIVAVRLTEPRHLFSTPLLHPSKGERCFVQQQHSTGHNRENGTRFFGTQNQTTHHTKLKPRENAIVVLRKCKSL